MVDKSKTHKSRNLNWFQARLRTKLWTMLVSILSLYAIFFAYAFFVQHVNLFDLGQLGLSKYGNNQAEVLRNIIWSYGLLIGGVFAVLGFVNAIHRTQQKDRELDTAEARLHIEQNSERRKTDAEIFAKSVEQLGHKEMAIRLGGLYSLENLARSAQALPLDTDNKAYLNSLLETLAAFVRMRASIPPEAERSEDDKVATDVEAAVRIISRTFAYDLRKSIKAAVDLRNCYLPRLEMPDDSDMENYNFQNTVLHSSRLNCANLRTADLQNANLTKAQLIHVNFYQAQLDDANFEKAFLNGADFLGAGLYSANLTDSYLSDANLAYAWLIETNLLGAKFMGANLTHAHLNVTNREDEPTNWTAEQFNQCVWSPNSPPDGCGVALSNDLQAVIDTRTKEIRDSELWEKYLAEREKD